MMSKRLGNPARTKQNMLLLQSQGENNKKNPKYNKEYPLGKTAPLHPNWGKGSFPLLQGLPHHIRYHILRQLNRISAGREL